MLEKQKACVWVATWYDKFGKLCTHTFRSVESRIVAGVDFRLALLDLGMSIPAEYTLDEASQPSQSQDTTHVSHILQVQSTIMS